MLSWGAGGQTSRAHADAEVQCSEQRPVTWSFLRSRISGQQFEVYFFRNPWRLLETTVPRTKNMYIIKLKFDLTTASRKVMESHGKRSWSAWSLSLAFCQQTPSDVEDLLVAFLATDWDEELIAAILAASQQEALGRSWKTIPSTVSVWCSFARPRRTTWAF